jgi:hypothetical protein
MRPEPVSSREGLTAFWAKRWEMTLRFKCPRPKIAVQLGIATSRINAPPSPVLPYFLHHPRNRAPINIEQLGNLGLTLRAETDHFDHLVG